MYLVIFNGTRPLDKGGIFPFTIAPETSWPDKRGIYKAIGLRIFIIASHMNIVSQHFILLKLYYIIQITRGDVYIYV